MPGCRPVDETLKSDNQLFLCLREVNCFTMCFCGMTVYSACGTVPTGSKT
jgi:hypothetical protein